MVAVLLIAFFALLIFGTPIITALMGSSLLSFAMYSTKDLKAVAQAMFASNGSFSLLAIPLFVLAGALMSSGGISKTCHSGSHWRHYDSCHDGKRL